MLIRPIITPQEISFRARPHTGAEDYFLVFWTDTQKVFGEIADMTYTDGRVSGEVAFPISEGLENGAKMNFRAFPVTDYLSLVDAIDTASDTDPFRLDISAMNDFIIAGVAASDIAPEIYRGQIFVSTRTEQPYTVS